MTIMCLAIADYIIHSINTLNINRVENKILLSCKRLQKLIYFSDVKYMKLHEGKSFCTDDYYAWESGPVIPNVYFTYVEFQYGEMTPLNEKCEFELPDDVKYVIDDILNETADMTTDELIAYSHVSGGPWHSHYIKNDLIPKQEIYNFYKGREIFA